MTVQVNGGREEQECLDVAFTIAHSPLVKTALFASDPNWGRLLAAIGRAGLADLEVNRVAVYLQRRADREWGLRAGSYTEEQGVAAMAPSDIVIRIELNRGDSEATVWTSDFPMTMSASMPNTGPDVSWVHVAVGVVLDESGRVLISRRAGDSHQGGLWSFPAARSSRETLERALAGTAGGSGHSHRAHQPTCCRCDMITATSGCC